MKKELKCFWKKKNTRNTNKTSDSEITVVQIKADGKKFLRKFLRENTL